MAERLAAGLVDLLTERGVEIDAARVTRRAVAYPGDGKAVEGLRRELAPSTAGSARRPCLPHRWRRLARRGRLRPTRTMGGDEPLPRGRRRGGSIAEALCDRIGREGRVVAVDLDTRFLSEIEAPNLEVHQLDVTVDEVPGGPSALVHARAVLEQLPAPGAMELGPSPS